MMNDNNNPARNLQRYVCEYLNGQLSSSGVELLVEDSKNIEFEIQNALKKQGLAAICMTPTMTYLGKTGNGQAWQCSDLTLQFVEYVPVNRAKNKASFVSGFDVAFDCQRLLAGPDAECGFGKFCPVNVEQGEDNGLMVVKATFDTYFVDEYIIPPAPIPVVWETGHFEIEGFGEFTWNADMYKYEQRLGYIDEQGITLSRFPDSWSSTNFDPTKSEQVVHMEHWEHGEDIDVKVTWYPS